MKQLLALEKFLSEFERRTLDFEISLSGFVCIEGTVG